MWLSVIAADLCRTACFAGFIGNPFEERQHIREQGLLKTAPPKPLLVWRSHLQAGEAAVIYDRVRETLAFSGKFF
jgi:hypothetical protein